MGGCIIASHLAAPGLIPSIPQNFPLNFSMLLGLIDGTAYCKVDRGLKMSIKPI